MHIANDNDPANRPDGDAAGFRALLREQEMNRGLHALGSNQADENLNTGPEAPHVKKKENLILALLLTIGTTLSAAYCAYSSQSVIVSCIALIAMVWSALWTAYLSSTEEQRAPFISEFSIILATFAGLAIWVAISREWGFALSAADGAAGFCGLTLITAAILRSRLTLLMSVCSGLIWLAIFMSTPSVNLVSIWAYPVLTTLQLLLAGPTQKKLTSFLALLGAYTWIIWSLNKHLLLGDISLLHVTAFCMMIGLAHFRLGKAAGDALWKSANLHVIFGWGLAMVGAIGLQSFWLGAWPELLQESSVHPRGTLTWQLLGAACLILIGIAGLIRMAYGQMSSLAVLFSLGVAVAAAATFDQRDTISILIENELFISAKPFLGLIIGAAIFTSAIAMCVNGARRKNTLLMLAGVTVIAIEIVLLFSPKYWTLEMGITFGFTLIIGLLLAALFAADKQQRLA